MRSVFILIGTYVKMPTPSHDGAFNSFKENQHAFLAYTIRFSLNRSIARCFVYMYIICMCNNCSAFYAWTHRFVCAFEHALRHRGDNTQSNSHNVMKNDHFIWNSEAMRKNFICNSTNQIWIDHVRFFGVRKSFKLFKITLFLKEKTKTTTQNPMREMNIA